MADDQDFSRLKIARQVKLTLYHMCQVCMGHRRCDEKDVVRICDPQI